MCTTMTFDFCAFGTKWRKRTAVLADHVDSADVWAVDTMRCRGHKWCSFTGEKHMQLVGYDFFINARVQTEAEFIRQNGPADSQFCFWDPPSPPECREHAMIWACNGRDDTPCCAESSLRNIHSVAPGLPCYPVAETLPRRDETQFLKRYERRVSCILF